MTIFVCVCHYMGQLYAYTHLSVPGLVLAMCTACMKFLSWLPVFLYLSNHSGGCGLFLGKVTASACWSHCWQLTAYMSTQREVFEGQTAARRAKRGGLWKGGPGVLPRKFSKTCIANGAIWVIPELYLSIQLAYIVIKCASKVSFKKHRPLCLTFCLCRCKCLWN